jgi:peptide/nickel transport system substrate-binding protein
MKYNQDLEIVPDLAKDYQISEDFKTYTFNLREDVQWHDGKKLTADDIVFTFKSAQDPNFKSPLLVSLRGVAVKKTGDYQVTFTLNEPYPSFLEVLTMGILPEHIWGEIPPINANLTEYNLKPIGSGPWQFKSLAKDRLGNIKSYTLVPFKDYYNKVPYLQNLTFKFYPDFETAISALNNQSIEGISYVPKELKDKITNKHLKFYSFHLPQYTAIFFHQKNNENLKLKSVRRALALSIDKTKILTEALMLEGEIIDSPILPGFIGYNPDLEKIPYDPNLASKSLDEAGFKQITAEEYQEFLTSQKEKLDEKPETKTEKDQTTEASETQPFYRKKGDKILEIKLTTVNLPENTKAAELIKEFWQAIGVKVNLEIVDATQISREIIRNRNYEALLYGEIIGTDPDPYPFWHSSQNQDPGLNLAVFANRKVDALLEEARATNDLEKRTNKYLEFQDILVKELPAIFLYTPTYTYVVNEKIKGIGMDKISVPHDRLNNLSSWYIKTGRRWHASTE